MATETETTIESIDIANDDLIDVLAQTAEYHRTRGAHSDARLAITGDGERKMLMPTETDEIDGGYVFGHQLVSDGVVKDEIEINGQTAELNVL